MHQYGCKRDVLDGQDLRFGLVRSHTELPTKVNLVETMPAIQDQGDTNNCVPYSIASIVQHLNREDTRDDDEWFPSPTFISWITRDFEGDTESDNGMSIRNAIKCVAKYGVCANDYWSENHNYDEKPDQRAFDFAKPNLIGCYSRVSHTLDSIKSCLSRGRPFLFGMTIYPQFESNDMTLSGVLEMPKGEKLGNHCVTCVGYDDSILSVLVRNSYGPKWGYPSILGHFWMPYQYILDHKLATDLWTIESVGDINEA